MEKKSLINRNEREIEKEKKNIKQLSDVKCSKSLLPL